VMNPQNEFIDFLIHKDLILCSFFILVTFFLFLVSILL
jgi:hypothetical protein